MFLFNSYLKLIFGKLRSRWDCPFVITNFFSQVQLKLKMKLPARSSKWTVANSSFFMRAPKWRRNLLQTSLWSCQFYVMMCLEWHLRSFLPFSFTCCLFVCISLHVSLFFVFSVFFFCFTVFVVIFVLYFASIFVSVSVSYLCLVLFCSVYFFVSIWCFYFVVFVWFCCFTFLHIKNNTDFTVVVF